MLEQVIVLSLLNSGVRRGELAGLTWKDVNFEECTIHISKSLLVFKRFWVSVDNDQGKQHPGCGRCTGVHGLPQRIL